MRIWGFDDLPISSGATAARRDVNLVLVLDRSGSLHPSNADAWDDVQVAAQFFVEQFDDSRDRLGLVTFGSNAAVDVPLNTGAEAAITSAITNQVVAESAATNSPEGLWLAYSELLRVSDANPINAIVFFTDGQPSAYTGSFPVRTAPYNGWSSAPYCSSSPREAVIGAFQRPNSPIFYEILGFWNRTANTAPVTLGNYFGRSHDFFIVSGCNNNYGNFDPYGSHVELLFDPNQCLPSSWTPTHPSIARSFSIVTGPYSVNQCSSLLKSTSTSTSYQDYRGAQVHNAAKNLSVNIANAARSDMALGGARVLLDRPRGLGVSGGRGLSRARLERRGLGLP